MKNIHDNEEKLSIIKKDVNDFTLFVEDDRDFEQKKLRDFSDKIYAHFEEIRDFILKSKQSFQSEQRLIPSHLFDNLLKMELVTESISNLLKNKNNQFQKMLQLRNEYNSELKTLRTLITDLQTKLRTRSFDYKGLKHYLEQIQNDFSNLLEKADQVLKISHRIFEKTQNSAEKKILQNEQTDINEQVNIIKDGVQEKKQELNDALNNVQKFFSLYEKILKCVQEKEKFLSKALILDTLQQIKDQHQQYSMELKSFQNATNMLSEMCKILEEIEKVSKTADLSTILQHAKELETAVVNGLQKKVLLH